MIVIFTYSFKQDISCPHNIYRHYFNILVHWNPVKSSCLMAGAQPKELLKWDAALTMRPSRYSGLINRFGWWRSKLFDVNDHPSRRDKRLCSNTSHVMSLA